MAATVHRAALTAAAAVLLLALAGPASAATWTAVTGPTPDTSAISDLRTPDGLLHVAWQRTSADGSTQEIVTATVDDGTATPRVSAPVTVVTSVAIASNPAIVRLADGALAVFYGGFPCTDTSTCPAGLYVSASTDGGQTWSTPTLAADTGGNYTADVNAVVAPDGTPFEAWWNPGTSVHRGTDPATPTQDFQPGGSGLYNNLAVDSAGNVEHAWDSLTTDSQGLFVQAVDPATGAPSGTAQLMPGSVANVNGAQSQAGTFTRTPITAVPGSPGVFYVAYPLLNPSGTSKIGLWRVGAPSTQTVSDDNFQHNAVSIAADSTGRVWVFWADADPTNGRPDVQARRLGSAGLEAPIDFGAPNPASTLYGLDGAVAPGGDPIVFARTGLAAGGTGTFYARGPQTAAPQNGRSVGAAPVSGVVLYKPPGSSTFVPLAAGAQIPVGSTVDVTKGKIRLTAAKAKHGTESAVFSAGAFVIGQKRGSSVAALRLAGGKFGICGRRSVGGGPLALAAKRHRRVRDLLGSGHGSFRTNGRYAAATVRGTIWDTEDDCDGTRVTVHRGVVQVTDLVRHRTVSVRAGRSYFAAAPGRR